MSETSERVVTVVSYDDLHRVAATRNMYAKRMSQNFPQIENYAAKQKRHETARYLMGVASELIDLLLDAHLEAATTERCPVTILELNQEARFLIDLGRLPGQIHEQSQSAEV